MQIIDGNACGIKNNSYLCAMKIKEIWIDAEHIYGRDEEGHEYSQSLLWYPKLRTATDKERAEYTFGFDGIHWRGLDEDISFESFTYNDTESTPLQRFFLTHKEINVAEFARSLGMNATLLRNYINGFKKPQPSVRVPSLPTSTNWARK